LDSKGTIYALVMLSTYPTTTRYIFAVNSWGDFIANTSLPIVPNSNYSPLPFLISPKDELLILNSTSNDDVQTCVLKAWDGPILTQCVLGFPIAMDDSGWLYTFDTSIYGMGVVKAYPPNKITPAWTFTINAFYAYFYGSFWANDMDILLFSLSNTNILYAFEPHTGSVLWKFSFTNYPSGMTLSDNIYLWSTNTIDIIDSKGFYQGRLFNMGMPLVSDAEGNLYGFLYPRIQAIDRDHNSMWSYTPPQGTIGTPSFAIGNNNTLFIMTPYGLSSVQN